MWVYYQDDGCLLYILEGLLGHLLQKTSCCLQVAWTGYYIKAEPMLKAQTTALFSPVCCLR